MTRWTEYFAHRLREFDQKSGYTAKRLRSAVSPRSFSQAEDFFLDLHRRYALVQGSVTFRTLVKDRVKARNGQTDQQGRYGTNDQIVRSCAFLIRGPRGD